MTRRRVAVLISGRGSNMMSLVEATRSPDYPAEIVGVLSNRSDAGGLDFARSQGIPATAVDHKAYSGKPAFEAAVDAQLREWGADLVCLAGFMRLLSAGFVDGWSGRALNIHPSLLPSFPGLHTHERALAAGVRIHGCSVHFLTPEMDVGPIVAQAAVPVLAGDDTDTLQARVLKAEHVLYPRALALVASGKARLDGDALVRADYPAPEILFVPPAV